MWISRASRPCTAAACRACTYTRYPVCSIHAARVGSGAGRGRCQRNVAFHWRRPNEVMRGHLYRPSQAKPAPCLSSTDSPPPAARSAPMSISLMSSASCIVRTSLLMDAVSLAATSSRATVAELDMPGNAETSRRDGAGPPPAVRLLTGATAKIASRELGGSRRERSEEAPRGRRHLNASQLLTHVDRGVVRPGRGWRR